MGSQMSSPDFSNKTIDILSSRAGQRCSNPDCDTLTTGPHTTEDKRLTIGEAAHIYGARPSERRYRPEMSNPERATISNAIWLCRNCHKEVDGDPQRFSAELLIAWKQEHENKIRSEVGTSGEKIRQTVIEKELELFQGIPPIAREIIRNRQKYWEYMLSAELFDHYTANPMRRARDLELGRIVKPMNFLDPDFFPRWLRKTPQELNLVVPAIFGLIEDMQIAWGRPGEPGNAKEIDHVCRLWGDLADFLVQVAEDVRFTTVPEGFEGVRDLLCRGALYVLKHFPELSSFLRNTITNNPNGGLVEFKLVIEFPEGWADDLCREIDRGLAALKDGESLW